MAPPTGIRIVAGRYWFPRIRTLTPAPWEGITANRAEKPATAMTEATTYRRFFMTPE
jgi:hypothetical protein